ncbi:MAG: inositol monophosphatase family protein, partial [Dehalococcoidia bacterium]
MVELPASASGKSAEEVARLCAQEAGRIIMAHFGRQEKMVVVSKGRGNFVTDADLAAEHAVLDLLRREYPDHSILS